jgi:mRNA interferase RelE/StbE
MTLYTIQIAPRAKKQIEILPENIKSRIADALSNILAKNPYMGKALKAGLKGLYSYRVGDYRIIYSIVRHQLIIQVIKVMHRREAYR